MSSFRSEAKMHSLPFPSPKNRPCCRSAQQGQGACRRDCELAEQRPSWVTLTQQPSQRAGINAKLRFWTALTTWMYSMANGVSTARPSLMLHATYRTTCQYPSYVDFKGEPYLKILRLGELIDICGGLRSEPVSISSECWTSHARTIDKSLNRYVAIEGAAHRLLVP